jgi:hypothetical protein
MAQSLRVRFKQWRKIARWKLAGSPLPPPHAWKVKMLRELAHRHGTRVLVETGTFMGDMIEAQRGEFDRLVSIELAPELHRKAVARFAGDPRIEILQGDSGRLIGDLVAQLKQPALFWLDGHYSGGETARGDADTPIVAELEAVLRSGVHHVVLVDDARCFNGSGGYPTVDALRALVEKLKPGAKVALAHDLISIE